MAEAKVDGIKPSKSIKTSVMDYIASAIAVPSDRLDADENLINLQNGVLDLNAMKLLPHSPEYHFTSQLPFAYDADALCPRWEQAMDEWMKGDQVAIKHLQEAFGLSLTTDVSHHKAWMLVGDGANGKDTFLNVLRAMAADGHYELDLPALAHNGYGLANLVGKRVITCSEAVGDRAVADDKLKRLISGDAMEVRAIYGRPFVLVPRSHVWWAVNEPPVVQDQSDGFWRRWFVVPFRAKFDDKARDRALGRKLQAEMPGIFNWGMRGLQRLRRRGRLIDVPLFGSATETYREENDVTAAFVDEHCDTGPEFSETPRRLYTQYHEYCESSGHRPKSLPRFGRDLVRLGYERVKSNGVRTYRGLRVRLGAGLMG
jgi:putative DNA primase/helicase